MLGGLQAEAEKDVELGLTKGGGKNKKTDTMLRASVASILVWQCFISATKINSPEHHKATTRRAVVNMPLLTLHFHSSVSFFYDYVIGHSENRSQFLPVRDKQMCFPLMVT